MSAIITRHLWPHIDNIKNNDIESHSKSNQGTLVQQSVAIISKTEQQKKKTFRRFLLWYPIRTLYNTLVLPHFDYCCTPWDVFSDTNISRLQKLQNRGMRILLGCHHRTHVSDTCMLSTLRWLNVRQRFHLLKCIIMYNIVKGNTPTYPNDVNIGISHK